MKLIYYNVSGVIMEILQFFLSFLLNEYGESLKPIMKALKDNDFDLKRTFRNLDLSTFLPLIKNFLQNGANKTRPENFSERVEVGVSPISNLADKDIVYTLNKYFCVEN